jgi:hypothetical protein
LIAEKPQYAKLAARLLSMYVDKEVRGQEGPLILFELVVVAGGDLERARRRQVQAALFAKPTGPTPTNALVMLLYAIKTQLQPRVHFTEYGSKRLSFTSAATAFATIESPVAKNALKRSMRWRSAGVTPTKSAETIQTVQR